MTIDKIRKRNGAVVPFDRAKIEAAMGKAFVATEAAIEQGALRELADRVMLRLEEKFVERIPEVENVQDIVELELAEAGHFEVAKSYIIYRRERAAAREEEKLRLLEQIEKSALKVQKRGGKTVRFDIREIEKAVRNCASRYPEVEIDVPGILADCKVGIYDGIPTSEINKVVLMAIKARIERDPVYGKLAARFLVNDLYKEVLGLDEFEKGFEEAYRTSFVTSVRKGVESGRLDPRLEKIDLEKLVGALAIERDGLFEYLGAQTLYDRYFLRDPQQRILELPQHFWMRVASGIAIAEEHAEERAIEFYDIMSQFLYVPSSPTLLHSGTASPQMSSCYLTTVEDDLRHIFKSIGDNAQLSKWSGGVANDWSNIRAVGSLIKSVNVPSQGVVPFLKIVDSTTAAINRSGKRRGATCVYLETWHYEIEDFLELRKNTGDDRRRTHDINTANWIPDLFMKRLLEDGQWTLFSPEEVPELHHTYGKEFEKHYAEYEAKADRGEIELWKRIKAADLWRKMITMLFETGHPWITFKDPSNVRSPQDHVGVVHSSNLCTEITLNTSKEEVAVCNLGSVNLSRHVSDHAIRWDDMARTIRAAVRMLDNVVEVGFYPIPEAKTSNLRHRPVGLGVMGYQDLLYEIGLGFESDAAVALSDQLMEFISYHAILASSELAKERGAYQSYKGSKWDRGLFPLDTLSLLEEERGLSTGVQRTARMDWAVVRAHVAEHGMRNSNVMAIAPTATNANINGCLPSIEPIYKNLYVKSNFSGEFTIINKYLVRDLKVLGLWTPHLIQKLKYYDGNVQRIMEIPAELRARYKEVFEIDPHWIVKHAAYRGKWIDQSQSVNIFTRSESGRFISSVYIDAWQSGLKTTYYLRTLAASSVEKSTIDINKSYENTPPAVKAAAQETAVATLASANVLGENLKEAVKHSASEAEKGPKNEILSASQVVAIAEDGLCESCQ